MKQITITNEAPANYSFGGGLTIKPGENVLPLDKWNEIKNLRHVRARIRAGSLIEGESFSEKKPKSKKKKLEEITPPDLSGDNDSVED